MAKQEDEHGNAIRMIGTGQDSSEPGRVDESSRVETTQLISAFDIMEECIYIADTGTYELLFTNRCLADILPKDSRGKKCYQVMYGFDVPCAFCTNAIILGQKPAPFRWEHYNAHLDRHYAIVDRIIRWGDGRDVRFEMAVDITGRKRTEDLLRERIERYELILEGAYGGFWDWDVPNRRVHYSSQWKAMRGYAEDEIGDSETEWLSGIHPVDAPSVLAGLDAHFAGKTDLFEEEYRIRRKDGVYVWVINRGKVVCNESGKVVRMAGSELDITNRKQAEKELQDSELRYRNLVNSGTALIWTSGTDRLCDYFNKQWLRFTGRKLQQELGNGWAEGVHPDDFQRCLEIYTGSFDRREPFEMEYRLRYHDGSYRWILDMGAPRYDSEGNFLGYLGHCYDINERKLLEQSLRFTQFAVDHLHDPLYWMDSQGKFIYVNKASCDVLGYTREELLTMSVSDIDPLYPVGQWSTNWQRLRAQGSQVIETQHKTRNGEVFPVEIHDNFIEVDGREYNCAFATNITERKKVQQEHERLHAQLIHAQKMESIGRLAGGVAHDFNNMLGVIQGNVEMAMEKVAPTESLYDNLVEIRNAARRSADLTWQLLAFARKQTVVPKVIDMNKTVESMLKMLRRLIGEDIDLVWLPGRELWPVKLDPTQIDQILVNLCVNARDAIAGVGKITIETDNTVVGDEYCALYTDVVPGEYVILAVSDNGCGMDDEMLAHIFEPFFTSKALGKGTGLGLASVYGAVRQNNGFIDLYSEPGRGTTIKICLPRHAAQAVPEMEEPVPQSLVRGSEVILLVEDEPAILEMTTKMLEQLGYHVLATSFPGEAIRMAREYSGRIDLLVTDVVMPEMNGVELARNLLAIRPNIRQMFMSGYTAEAMVNNCMSDPRTQFIQKPFSKKEMAAKIREALA